MVGVEPPHQVAPYKNRITNAVDLGSFLVALAHHIGWPRRRQTCTRIFGMMNCGIDYVPGKTLLPPRWNNPGDCRYR